MKRLDNLIKALIILIIIGVVFGIGYLIIGGVKLSNIEEDSKEKVEISKEDVEKDDKKEKDEKKKAERKRLENLEKERIEKEKIERKKREDELRRKEEQEKEEEEKKADEEKSKKGKNLIDKGKAYAVSAKKINEMIKGKKNGQKEVFLTFDDGPSENTKKILEILERYNVHGTFFVLGSNLNSSNENYLKEVYNSGNAIGNHTYSHNYKIIYPNNKVNINTFMNEVKKTNKLLSRILGEDFNTSIIRMPGGYVSRKYHKDPNLKELNKVFDKEKVTSIDWNIDSADSSGLNVPTEKIVNATIKGIGNLEDVILLMHDTGSKETTAQALPKIIEHFQKSGYVFKVISN
ncbi:MAG: polysaccharide deacetylase family protein [Clostridium sp.]|uniref:polysaccharide deacetylase family protein n=1 Tax=Clostridium sp. TaxID=1506 RepID=UPI003EE45ED6